jgi:hypothetical protein
MIISTLIISGCATVTRSSYERFIVETEPEGAKVKLTSGESCITPCNLLKKRNKSFSCQVEKDGYQPVEINVEAKVAGAGAAGFVGNAAIGGVIGAGIDIYSGAALGLYPNPLIIELKEIKIDENFPKNSLKDMSKIENTKGGM